MNSNDGSKVDEGLLKMLMEKVSVKVSAAQAAVLEADITLAELEAALKLCAREAAPGVDGLTVAFWLALWKELGPLLLLAVQEGWEAGRFREHFNMAVIVLLLKKDKSRLLCGDWRPVSLLNWAYKIVTKVVSLRLNVVLPFLVSSKQSAWVKGRSIHDTVTIIQGVIKLASSVDRKFKDAAILFLDLVKAFDTVAWRVLFDFVLPGFGFPVKFVNLIRALYAGAGSKIMLNGFLSALFSIGCGVRQGDSASPPLFALFVELFALAFECVPSARPLVGPGGIDVDVEMYADYITTITRLEHLPAIKLVVELFEKSTGMSFGKDCTVFVPGMEGAELPAASRLMIRDLGWSLLDGAGRHKSLGMIIGHGVGNAEVLSKVLDKLAAAEKRFAPFQLDPLARVMVSKVYMLSYLNFTAAVVDWDPELLQAVKAFIGRWVWKGRNVPRLDAELCCLPTKVGGLGCFSLEEAVMSRRLRQLFRCTMGGPMPERMGQFVAVEVLGAVVAQFHGVQGLLSAGAIESVLLHLPRVGGRGVFSPQKALLLSLLAVLQKAVPRSAVLPLGEAQPALSVLPHGVALPGGAGWDDAAFFPVFDVRFPAAGAVGRPPGVRVFSPSLLSEVGVGSGAAQRALWLEKQNAGVIALAGVRSVGNLVVQHGACAGMLLSQHGSVGERFFPVGSALGLRWCGERLDEFNVLAAAVPAGLLAAMAGPKRFPLVGDFYVKCGQAAYLGGRPACVVAAERRWAGCAARGVGFAGEDCVYRVTSVRQSVGAGGVPVVGVWLAKCMIMKDCVVMEMPFVEDDPGRSTSLLGFHDLYRLAFVTPDHRYAGVVSEGAAFGCSFGVASPAGAGGGAVVIRALFQLSGKQLYTLLMSSKPTPVRDWVLGWAAELVPVAPAPALLALGAAGAGAGVVVGLAAGGAVVAGGAARAVGMPASVELVGSGGVFHRLQAPGLLGAYQRTLLLWIYLRRVWTNERCKRILKKGNPNCLVCGGGVVECLRHLFWDCPAVRAGWRMVLCLFADLRGLPRPLFGAMADWSSSRFVAAMLGTTPEWPVVVARPASRQDALIWLVLKAELLSCIWRMRCRLILGDGAPAAVAVVPHSGAEVVRMLQAILRHRVMEERYLSSDGLVFEDWMARGALGKEDGALGGAITFSPLMGGVSRWIAEREDPNAPDYLCAGLPVLR